MQTGGRAISHASLSPAVARHSFLAGRSPSPCGSFSRLPFRGRPFVSLIALRLRLGFLRGGSSSGKDCAVAFGDFASRGVAFATSGRARVSQQGTPMTLLITEPSRSRKQNLKRFSHLVEKSSHELFCFVTIVIYGGSIRLDLDRGGLTLAPHPRYPARTTVNGSTYKSPRTGYCFA
jgi:hypothetical protein